MQEIKGDWAVALKDEFNKPYYKELMKKIELAKKTHEVYPPENLIFNALELTPLYSVKVVIIGQDPYHEPGQAHGLCFSVPNGCKLPPSLVNIYKEIHDELGIQMSNSGDLTKWAKQGVLLLNSSLTVNRGQAGSHKDFGWENFTRRIVEIVNEKLSEVIFVLWGNFAKQFEPLINPNRHFILKSAHPSPLSTYNGFFGNGHFKRINTILKDLGKEEIDWKI